MGEMSPNGWMWGLAPRASPAPTGVTLAHDADSGASSVTYLLHNAPIKRTRRSVSPHGHMHADVLLSYVFCSELILRYFNYYVRFYPSLFWESTTRNYENNGPKKSHFKLYVILSPIYSSSVDYFEIRLDTLYLNLTSVSDSFHPSVSRRWSHVFITSLRVTFNYLNRLNLMDNSHLNTVLNTLP